jgi:putative ABC transport system permease protein
MLLSGNFLKLVSAGILVAWPLGWWLMNRWLQSFAYHIEIDASVFVISGITAITLAILTVSVHAMKTALTNPVRNLRTE